MKHRREIIGIVGGLCPLATADIYLKAMKQVKSLRGDVDYPDIIISAALEQACRGNEFEDAPGHRYDMTHRMLYIYQVAKELKERGVDKVLVPGFLSYSFIDTIKANLDIPLVDIVELLIDEIKEQWPNAKNIGLLTTTSSISEGVFTAKFASAGLTPVYPEDSIQQNNVMAAVYGLSGIKRGVFSEVPGDLIKAACEHLFAKGADVVVSAITELPLIDRCYYPEDKYLDCNEAIGKGLVRIEADANRKPDAQKIIGILGGLGPAATVDVFDKIVSHTPATCDQEHIKVIIENNPQIPDRTASLQGKGDNPSLAMLATAEKLQQAGADFIIVPCNTAHAFVSHIQEHLEVPILNMLDETADYIKTNFDGIKTVGLLATSGTIESGVYKDALKRRNLDLVVPSESTQRDLVMEAIYGKEGVKAGFKTGKPKSQFQTAGKELIEQGAQVIIMGCTEIPLALHNGDLEVPLVDATDILAKAAVTRALQCS
jgi:aspartate racemase